MIDILYYGCVAIMTTHDEKVASTRANHTTMKLKHAQLLFGKRLRFLSGSVEHLSLPAYMIHDEDSAIIQCHVRVDWLSKPDHDTTDPSRFVRTKPGDGGATSCWLEDWSGGSDGRPRAHCITRATVPSIKDSSPLSCSPSGRCTPVLSSP